jgi:Uma2 family endonuclease
MGWRYCQSVCPYVNELRRLELKDNAAVGRQVWLLNPRCKRISCPSNCPGQSVEILENPPTLSGETVLPGFTFALNRIFA